MVRYLLFALAFAIACVSPVVVSPTPQERVVIIPPSGEIRVGEELIFKAELVTKDSLLPEFNWRTTNGEILYIGLFTGKVTGMKPGTSQICVSVLSFYRIKPDGSKETVRPGSLNERGFLNEQCTDKPFVVKPVSPLQ